MERKEKHKNNLKTSQVMKNNKWTTMQTSGGEIFVNVSRDVLVSNKKKKKCISSDETTSVG